MYMKYKSAKAANYTRRTASIMGKSSLIPLSREHYRRLRAKRVNLEITKHERIIKLGDDGKVGSAPFEEVGEKRFHTIKDIIVSN